MNPEIQLICRDCGDKLRESTRKMDQLSGTLIIKVYPCQYCLDVEWEDGYEEGKDA